MNTKQLHPEAAEPVTIEGIRQAIGSVLVSRDVIEFGELLTEFGHIPVWIDDPTGHFPLRRKHIHELRAEAGYDINRIYWRDDTEVGDARPTGREFTLTSAKLPGITRVLSEENIE